MTHRLPALVLALALALPAAACGSDSDSDEGSPSPSTSSSATSSSSPTGTASAEVCAALDQLTQDVKALKDDKTAAEYSADLTAISADFKKLADVAGTAYADDVDTFQAALTTFADQLKSLGNGQGALQALQDLGQAAGDLEDALASLAGQIKCSS
ncbi:hypothetical protein ACT8ZV_00075 [Nocardioides sp. MAHUQ-72]|uniref:hypothetical protein n=1 Tax=unclassified Nocardioides TaxID=2615069 RepID=UPI003616014E